MRTLLAGSSRLFQVLAWRPATIRREARGVLHDSPHDVFLFQTCRIVVQASRRGRPELSRVLPRSSPGGGGLGGPAVGMMVALVLERADPFASFPGAGDRRAPLARPRGPKNNGRLKARIADPSVGNALRGVPRKADRYRCPGSRNATEGVPSRCRTRHDPSLQAGRCFLKPVHRGFPPGPIHCSLTTRFWARLTWGRFSRALGVGRWALAAKSLVPNAYRLSPNAYSPPHGPYHGLPTATPTRS